ncbi:hypothetical protein B0H14DRAFT_1622777 [Mycena olivaceomarginata]|nr:hypothetical protein B0H14DRAFT_1622777 [Mycena olivaceomarginata]
MSNLRQLSADINPLFIRDRVDFNHSIFAGITHLDMFETPLSENRVTDICCLPRLTHLSFNFDSSGPSVDIVHVHHIIANSKSLEVLVLIFGDVDHQAEFDDLYQCFGDDPRSVVVSVPDFIGIAREVPPVETITGPRRNDSSRAAIRRNQRVRLCGAIAVGVVDLQPACSIPTKYRSGQILHSTRTHRRYSYHTVATYGSSTK